MDPKGRDEMLALVRDIVANKGIALILSSHLLPDVEFACEHVVVLDKGIVATQGPISALRGTTGRVFELRVKGDGQRFADVLRAEGIECHGDLNEVMRVFVPERQGSQLLFQLAARHGMQVRHLRPSVPTLEDVFARAVGEET
jgi:ABC-2 type transport system ATP-binding protein